MQWGAVRKWYIYITSCWKIPWEPWLKMRLMIQSSISKLHEHFLSSLRSPMYPVVISMTHMTAVVSRSNRINYSPDNVYINKMHATWPTLETHLSLMRPIEINLSFSGCKTKTSMLMNISHSAYEVLCCYQPNLLISAGSFLLRPMTHSLVNSHCSLSQKTLDLQWHRKQILLSSSASF